MTRPHLVGTSPGLRTSAADYRLEEVAPIWFELVGWGVCIGDISECPWT